MAHGIFKVSVTVVLPVNQMGGGHDRWTAQEPNEQFDFYTVVCPQVGDNVKLDGKRYKVYSAPTFILQAEHNGVQFSHNDLSHVELIVKLY